MGSIPVFLYGEAGALEVRTPLKLSCLTGSESARRRGEEPVGEDLLRWPWINSRSLSLRGVNIDCRNNQAHTHKGYGNTHYKWLLSTHLDCVHVYVVEGGLLHITL